MSQEEETEEGVSSKEISDEVNRLKRSRAGHLGDLSRIYKTQEILSATSEDDVIEDHVSKYEEAFRKFVDAHEKYIQFETDEDKRILLDSVYTSQRDLKWTTDQGLSRRKTRKDQSKLEENVSSKGSRRSSKSKSSQSRSHEAMRKLEEARLAMSEMGARLELQRSFEEEKAEEERRRSQRRAEFQRKIEVLKAKSKLEKAQINLLLEEQGSQSASDRSEFHFNLPINLPNLIVYDSNKKLQLGESEVPKTEKLDEKGSQRPKVVMLERPEGHRFEVAQGAPDIPEPRADVSEP